MIANCPSCKKHEYQDQKYGIKKRVFNPCQKSGSRVIIKYRCTVCSREIDAPKEVKKDSTKKEK